MPVSVLCESASVNAAIRDSLANSAANNSNSCLSSQHHDDSLHNKLVASTKRVLLTKIEYEEVNNYGQSVLDTLKSKYIVLKPTSNSGKFHQFNGGSIGEKSDQTQTNGGNSEKANGQRSPNELPQPKRVLFPRENVQIGWKASNRKWQIGAGMVNLTNTCYLNSTLQALFHVPAVANWLISDSAHRERCEDENGNSCIICAMSKTLINSQNSQSAIRPYMVYSKLKMICKHLVVARQEDAHEFLRYLVEAMEKSYLSRFRNWKELDQYSKETTPLNQILGGYLRSAVRCLTCGHVSTTFQHFEDLLLDIRKADTIEDALDVYFARERLEDMGYKCEACKKKVSATKQFSLERAPISLCIQLKRFSMMGTKINKHIALRSRLDLTKFAARKNGEQLTYKLVSMITHLGASQHCGHYTAIGLTDSGSYYQFDDSCVRPISMQSVINTNAYIVFYELDNNSQTANGQNASRQTSTQVSGNQENGNGKNGYSEHGTRNGHLPSSSSAVSASSSATSQPAVISKLDTDHKIIGPQLPDGYKNGFTTNSSSKLVNSPTKHFKSTQPQTPTNKLVITFKNDQSAASSTTPDPEQSSDNRYTLPSMPKLGGSPQVADKSKVTPATTTTTNGTTPTKSTGLNGHAVTPNKNSPLKSLVPYESESSDSDDDDDKQLPANKLKRTENGNSNAKLQTATTNINSLYDSDDDFGVEPPPSHFKRAKSTPPSPPVVQSKTGVWQVTPVRPSSSSNASPPEKKSKNPFGSQSSTSTTSGDLFTRRTKNGVEKNGEKNENENNGTVNELLKLSHRGYGAPVLNWNGQKADLEKEVSEEHRQDRKRDLQDEEENEMDRGRQKKAKIFRETNHSNPGFNPFQEQQNQQNGGNRRWKNGGSGGGASYSSTGNRFNQSNNHFNNRNNFNRNGNSNFKRFNNKFHQRPHHQRANGNDFHRRSD